MVPTAHLFVGPPDEKMLRRSLAQYRKRKREWT